MPMELCPKCGVVQSLDPCEGQRCVVCGHEWFIEFENGGSVGTQTFVLRNGMEEDWRVSVDGRVTTPSFNSKGAADAYADGIRAGTRKPEFSLAQNEDYNERNTFKEGDRVEFHPGTDLWMQGARYGTVLREIDRPPHQLARGRRYQVKADKKLQPVTVSPGRIRRIK